MGDGVGVFYAGGAALRASGGGVVRGWGKGGVLCKKRGVLCGWGCVLCRRTGVFCASVDALYAGGGVSRRPEAFYAGVEVFYAGREAFCADGEGGCFMWAGRCFFWNTVSGCRNNAMT